MSDADWLAERLAELDAIGVGTEGVHRLAWTEEDAALARWFAGTAATLGLAVERDPAGNLWACPDTPAPWSVVGSHLDSVRGGGRFDGPLGVICGFAVAAAARRPVAVVSFADEEGARFNTPTFGSKALTGRLALPEVLERTDEHGVRLGDAMASFGVAPGGLWDAEAWVERIESFHEIHIDQSTAAAAAGVPVTVVASLAARTRLEVTVRGRSDHAGTTPRSERSDALAAAARLIVAADEVAPAGDAFRVTTARMLVEPNAATTIAERVRLWIDARAPEPAALDTWRAAVEDRAAALAVRHRVEMTSEVASRSDAVMFDGELRGALREAAVQTVGRPVPEDVCFAGHDAGVLAATRPAAMVLVRNPTGVSHAPAEAVSLADAAVAVEVVRAAIEAGS